MRVPYFLMIRAFAAAMFVSAAGSFSVSSAKAAETVEVHVANFTFAPQLITVRKGTTVVWINRDDTPHRVVAIKSQFKSPVLDTDETFQWTFTDAGKFPYFCSMHPHMTGIVTVTAN